jgi:MoaA/NifB/PqqE/SkfB family radical SAM enzyme
MAKISYKDLGASLQYDEDTDRFVGFTIPSPLSVCYKINKKCNLRCGYCIATSSPDASDGLPTDKAKALIQKIAESGIKRLDITGGEPFLRSDIMDIINFSVSQGLETVVTTNGYYITDEISQKLANLEVFTQVSIDGPQPVMDRVRGKGAYEAAISALKKLNDAGVQTRINCVLQKRYADELDEIMPSMVKLAEELNTGSLYFIIVCAQGRASGGRDKFCFSPSEESEIRKKIQSIRETSSIKVKMLDFRQYQRACVLVDTFGEFIAQGWSDEDCVNTGNVFERDIKDMWVHSGAFDHAVHLLQYLRHPALYQ